MDIWTVTEWFLSSGIREERTVLNWIGAIGAFVLLNIGVNFQLKMWGVKVTCKNGGVKFFASKVLVACGKKYQLNEIELRKTQLFLFYSIVVLYFVFSIILLLALFYKVEDVL